MSIGSRCLLVFVLAAYLGASAGCAGSSRMGGDAAPAAAVPDPREENPWFAAGRLEVARSARRIEGQPRARNVILFVGDGMGVSTVTAARILEGQRKELDGEENSLSFEALSQLALSKTYSVDSQVADSASTMTAMVSGVKTLSGVFGVDESVRIGDHSSVESSRVPTILEEAEMRGLATGIVSTATVTHATPGGCYAHVPLRRWQDDSLMSADARAEQFPDIARQLIEFEFGDGLEVVLGGGRAHFTPTDTADPEEPERHGNRVDGRDLTQEWLEQDESAAYVWNREQFEALDLSGTRHLLGLFEPQHMKWETDRGGDSAGEPSLAEMTAAAIEILARDEQGFFLMVEGGRIDHAHHAGNAQRALVDTIALSDAVRVALETTDPRDTLVVVTADHSHTLTIGGYPERGNSILGLVVGSKYSGGGTEEVAKDLRGKPYTTLSYANGPGHTSARRGAQRDRAQGPHRGGDDRPPCAQRPHADCRAETGPSGRLDLSEVDTQDPDYLQNATIPLRSETHAGEDVPIFAGGARAALFHGVREQSYIYHAMVEAFGWTRAGRPVD
jgi:alkaline phosphatase